MLKRVLAVAQTGAEAFRWLGSESYSDVRIRDHLRERKVGTAALGVLSAVASNLPEFKYESVVRNMLNPDHQLLHVGAEATVFDCGDHVMKYLTGKSQDVDTLAQRISSHQEEISGYIGDYLPPSKVDTSRCKVYKHLPAQNYVRILQRKVIIDKNSPHADDEFLRHNPEAAEQLGDFADGLVELFRNTGLLMDIVNKDNLVWGRLEEHDKPRLMLIDTIPVDIAEDDFTGIHVPLWRPDLHLESLVEFALRFSDLSDEVAS